MPEFVRRWCRIARRHGHAALLPLLLSIGAPAHAQVQFTEHFDAPPDEEVWSSIRGEHVKVQYSVKRSGNGALMSTGGFDDLCARKWGKIPDDVELEDANCIKNELRIQDAHRLRTGTAVWHGFSLLVGGDVARSGSIRTVLAQWKETGGASPFFALRFDNGVLHASVQHNNCRILLTAQRHVADSLTGVLTEDAPTPAFVTLAEGVVPPSLSDYLQSIAYSAEPEAFCDPSEVGVTVRTERELPDPSKSWIDIAVLLQRDLHEGRVELWANDQLRAVATGPIGSNFVTRHPDPTERPDRSDEPPKQYEKFGIYGDVCTVRHRKLREAKVAICRVGMMRAYYDNYRRGQSREAVDPSLIYPR